MPTKQIANDWGAWSSGASWQINNPVGNTQSQMVTNMVNGSGANLYTGDVVIATTDATYGATGVIATTTTSASNPQVIGVVGGETNMAFAGGPIPLIDVPQRYDTVTVAASATQSDTAAVASDVGKGVSGANIPLGAYIVSVVPGTSFTMNVAATGTGSAQLLIGPRTSSVGPGWIAPSGVSFPVGEVMPVVLSGWAYVNVGANTVAAGGLLASSATARVAAAVVSSALLIGTYIAVALEAQNATGVITSGDGSASVLVRSWVGKF